MTVDELAPEVLKLPVHERAILAASLWESLEDPYLMPESLDEEAALALAEQRDAEMASGVVMPLTHAELMERLRR